MASIQQLGDQILHSGQDITRTERRQRRDVVRLVERSLSIAVVTHLRPCLYAINCSELRISVAPLDNMAGFQLTLLENIVRTPLTLCENRLALTKNSLITSVPAHVR